MIRNYLIISLRKIRNNLGYTFINCGGLAISLAACLLIAIYILYNLGFDRFHENEENIYRITSLYTHGDESNLTGLMQAPMAETVVDEIPGVKAAVRIINQNNQLVSSGDKSFYQQILAADPSFLKVFSFDLISGNLNNALSNPKKVLLSESTAKKYFPDENAIGKTIVIDEGTEYTVSAIIQDPPDQSHISYSIIIPMPDSLHGVSLTEWDVFSAFYTYILLSPDADPKAVEQKIPSVLKNRISEKQLARNKFILQPIADIHLYSELSYELIPDKNVDVGYIYTFGAIGLLILIIASVNYINLSTARAIDSYREIGVRKVTGATKQDLFWQFISESLIISAIAGLIALVMVEIFLPYFTDIIGVEIDTGYISEPLFYGCFILFVLIIGFLAGIYPAIFLSSFNPVKAFNFNSIKDIHSGAGLRKSLVILQFSLTMIMIMSTVVIFQQLDYLQNKNLGLNPEQVLSIQLDSEGTKDISDVLKDKLAQHSQIEYISISSGLPSQPGTITYLQETGKRNNDGPIKTFSNRVDTDFINTLGINLAEGRGFNENDKIKKPLPLIINETLAHELGWSKSEAIGKRMNMGEVIGVVEDFHFTSFTETIGPAIMSPIQSNPRYLTMRLSTKNITGTLDYIESQWKKVAPSYPLQLLFLDEAFENLYQKEKRLGVLFTGFSTLAVVIACMGLFGLVSFMTSKKAKEISIRKVLGATVSSIMILLGKNYIKLVFSGAIIAIPIAWIATNSWLQNFAYRTEIDITIIFITLCLALLITILTISGQSIKAATANPVKNLRKE